jgi:hypothetical protein
LQTALTDVAKAIPLAMLVEADADRFAQPDAAAGLGG